MTTTAVTKKKTEQAPAIVQRSPLNALAARFNTEPLKLLEVLRGTIIKPSKDGKAATDAEVGAFCIVADQYGLNPFLKEIHAFTSGDKGIVPIVGIDGWTKLVNRSMDFDGVTFSYADKDDGTPLSVTCTMQLKNREHPVVVTEYLDECKRNSPPWNQMPRRMLRHKAYMQCARLAFGLSGIYDEDEAHDIIKNAEVISVGAPIQMPQEAAPASAAEPAPPAEPVPEQEEAAFDRQAAIDKIIVCMGTAPKGNVSRALKSVGATSEDWQQLDDTQIADLLKLLEAA